MGVWTCTDVRVTSDKIILFFSQTATHYMMCASIQTSPYWPMLFLSVDLCISMYTCIFRRYLTQISGVQVDNVNTSKSKQVFIKFRAGIYPIKWGKLQEISLCIMFFQVLKNSFCIESHERAGLYLN